MSASRFWRVGASSKKQSVDFVGVLADAVLDTFENGWSVALDKQIPVALLACLPTAQTAAFCVKLTGEINAGGFLLIVPVVHTGLGIVDIEVMITVPARASGMNGAILRHVLLRSATVKPRGRVHHLLSLRFGLKQRPDGFNLVTFPILGGIGPQRSCLLSFGCNGSGRWIACARFIDKRQRLGLKRTCGGAAR